MSSLPYDNGDRFEEATSNLNQNPSQPGRSKLEIERSHASMDYQNQIRSLEERLKRQRAECAEEKRRLAEINTERYEMRRRWEEERDAVMQQTLGDIAKRLQDETTEARRWRELDEQRFKEAELRRREKTGRMQELHDLVHAVIADGSSTSGGSVTKW